MITNSVNYNPLPNILNLFKYYFIDPGDSLDNIKKELYLAGIVPENESEFISLLNLLVDLFRENNVK